MSIGQNLLDFGKIFVSFILTSIIVEFFKNWWKHKKDKSDVRNKILSDLFPLVSEQAVLHASNSIITGKIFKSDLAPFCKVASKYHFLHKDLSKYYIEISNVIEAVSEIVGYVQTYYHDDPRYNDTVTFFVPPERGSEYETEKMKTLKESFNRFSSEAARIRLLIKRKYPDIVKKMLEESSS